MILDWLALVSEAIQKRIAEFWPPMIQVDWVKPAVRAHAFLPLYVGWSAALGLRPDGSFIRWTTRMTRRT